MSGTLRIVPRRVRVIGDLFHGRVPDGAVYVGRAAPGLPGSRYANPYSVRRHGLDESRRLFRAWLTARPDIVAAAGVDLAGRDLACWCRPDASWCHADEWLRLLAAITGSARGDAPHDTVIQLDLFAESGGGAA